jgi:hypothetical protein
MGVAGHKARGCRPAPREPTALLFEPLSANRGPNSTFIELENEPNLADRGTRGHGVPSGAAAGAWRPHQGRMYRSRMIRVKMEAGSCRQRTIAKIEADQ